MVTATQRGVRALVVGVVVVVLAGLASAWVGSVAVTDPHASLDPERIQRGLATAWLARLLLLLAGAWLLIGMVAARTALVRRPGAAAARATWLASSRPWRARESMLGLLPFDRVLMIVVPGGLLAATCAVATSLLLPWPIVLVVGGAVLFAVVVVALVTPRSPWPAIAAIGGVIVVQCVTTLIGIAIAGAGGYWLALWRHPPLRFVVFTVTLALIVWTAVAAGGAISAQVGARRATGVVGAGIGTAVLVPSLIVAIIGAEPIGRAWEDSIVHLAAPEPLAWIAVAFGAVLLVVGLIVSRRSPRGSTDATR